MNAICFLCCCCCCCLNVNIHLQISISLYSSSNIHLSIFILQYLLLPSIINALRFLCCCPDNSDEDPYMCMKRAIIYDLPAYLLINLVCSDDLPFFLKTLTSTLIVNQLYFCQFSFHTNIHRAMNDHEKSKLPTNL